MVLNFKPDPFFGFEIGVLELFLHLIDVMRGVGFIFCAVSCCIKQVDVVGAKINFCVGGFVGSVNVPV